MEIPKASLFLRTNAATASPSAFEETIRSKAKPRGWQLGLLLSALPPMSSICGSALAITLHELITALRIPIPLHIDAVSTLRSMGFGVAVAFGVSFGVVGGASVVAWGLIVLVDWGVRVVGFGSWLTEGLGAL